MSIPHGLKRTLVIASGNAGKVREFRELLQQLPLELQPQPEGMEVEETGLTFAENARLKALAVAKARVKHESFRGALREMLDHLRSGSVPQTECHDNIKSLAMVFAAIESSKKGRAVNVRGL